MTDVSIHIPFSGFYGSLWDGEVDRELESLIDHVTEEPDHYSPALVLAAKRGHLGELLWDVTDYDTIQEAISKDYVEAFSERLSDWLGRPVSLTFEELNSPRYYNFTTDRIFALFPQDVVADLYQAVMGKHRPAFDDAVRAAFTSRDGFSSFYDNDPDALAAKPLDQWDHNELSILLEVIVRADDTVRREGLDLVLYYDLGDDIYRAVDSGIDWPTLEDKAKAWADDLDDLDEAEAERLHNPRCTETLELPL